jgi:hypothetical protein
MMLKYKKNGKEGKETILSNYYCFLFNDLFIYSSKSKLTERVNTAKEERNATAILKNTYQYKGNFIINKIAIKDLQDTDLLKNAFQITYDNKDIFTFCTNSSIEKTEWIQIFIRVIDESQKKKVFGVSLNELMKNPNYIAKSIPPFIENILNYIDKNGH